jgi:type IV pilus assembly protein PilY1
LNKSGWNVAGIFSGNPGSSSASGTFGGGIDGSDAGRKTFYAPAVSWGGSGPYFDAGNYGFPDVTFSGQYDIASLYFGTGDREHPTYTMVRNRIYAVYDDSSVSGKTSGGSTVQVSTIPYTEGDLLNLSCGELEEGTTLSAPFTKDQLTTALTDDAEYYLGLNRKLENGIGENDAKGWYIVLEDQGDATECSHCTFAGAIDDSTTSSRDNHDGEQILSQVGLYAGVLYFTSYQSSFDDPCNPQGNGFLYSINYADGSAAYNLNAGNDGVNAGNDGADAITDVTDRYRKVNSIYGIPSKFAIVTRHGGAGAMAMLGGKIVGPKPGPGDDDDDDDGDDDDGFKIKSPGLGLELYYWREGNSME